MSQLHMLAHVCCTPTTGLRPGLWILGPLAPHRLSQTSPGSSARVLGVHRVHSFSFGTPYVQSGRLSIQALTSLPFSVVLEELRTFSTKQLPEYVVLEKKCKTEALVRLCTVLG